MQKFRLDTISEYPEYPKVLMVRNAVVNQQKGQKHWLEQPVVKPPYKPYQPVTSFKSKQNPKTAESLNEYWSNNGIYNIDPEGVAKLIHLESKYDVNAGSKYKGLAQIGENEFKSYFGSNKGSAIYNQYKNKTRRLSDAMNDVHTHMKRLSNKYPFEYITFGRMMLNQFAPNAKLSSKISNTVWDNNIKYMVNDGRLPKSLVKGKSTYKDLMDAFNNDYVEH